MAAPKGLCWLLLALWLLAPAEGGGSVKISTPRELTDALKDPGAAWIEVVGVIALASGGEPLGNDPVQLSRDLLVTAASPGAALDLGHGGGRGSLVVG